MQKKKTEMVKLIIWLIAVWVASAICYLPMFLSYAGIGVPPVMINLKYLNILVPFMFTVTALIRKRGIKEFIKNTINFNSKEAWFLVVLVLVESIIFSLIVSKKVNLPQLVFASVYMFVMAAIEEVTWRGFLLSKKGVFSKFFPLALFTSISWALWHIPMWVVRNGVGIDRLGYWILFAGTVGMILSFVYLRYQSIVFTSIIHTFINIFGDTDIRINFLYVIVVGFSILVFCKYCDWKKLNNMSY